MRDGEIVIEERSLAKGVLAGLIGGLVATAAKSLAEKVYPPRFHGEIAPPELLAERIAGRELSAVQSFAAAETIPWGFGAAVGAAYGGLAEYFPAATDKDGASFGMALATLAHETALPAMGLAPEPEIQTPREFASEVATHVIFGVVTETVRRFVRRQL